MDYQLIDADGMRREPEARHALRIQHWFQPQPGQSPRKMRPSTQSRFHRHRSFMSAIATELSAHSLITKQFADVVSTEHRPGTRPRGSARSGERQERSSPQAGRAPVART